MPQPGPVRTVPVGRSQACRAWSRRKAAWTARRWAGWALLVGAVGVVLAVVALLAG